MRPTLLLVKWTMIAMIPRHHLTDVLYLSITSEARPNVTQLNAQTLPVNDSGPASHAPADASYVAPFSVPQTTPFLACV